MSLLRTLHLRLLHGKRKYAGSRRRTFPLPLLVVRNRLRIQLRTRRVVRDCCGERAGCRGTFLVTIVKIARRAEVYVPSAGKFFGTRMSPGQLPGRDDGAKNGAGIRSDTLTNRGAY